jgi:hypothetical protein
VCTVLLCKAATSQRNKGGKLAGYLGAQLNLFQDLLVIQDATRVSPVFTQQFYKVWVFLFFGWLLRYPEIDETLL